MLIECRLSVNQDVDWVSIEYQSRCWLSVDWVSIEMLIECRLSQCQSRSWLSVDQGYRSTLNHGCLKYKWSKKYDGKRRVFLAKFETFWILCQSSTLQEVHKEVQLWKHIYMLIKMRCELQVWFNFVNDKWIKKYYRVWSKQEFDTAHKVKFWFLLCFVFLNFICLWFLMGCKPSEEIVLQCTTNCHQGYLFSDQVLPEKGTTSHDKTV